MMNELARVLRTDLAVAIAGETHLGGLLEKALLYLRLQTGSSSGAALLGPRCQAARVTAVVGALTGEHSPPWVLGNTIDLPASFALGPIALLGGSELAGEPIDPSYHRALRLPVGELATLFLFAPERLGPSASPTDVFTPMLEELTRRALRCQAESTGAQPAPTTESLLPPSQDQRFLHDLYRHIPELVWLKDANGVYLSCNRAFERFVGAPQADVVGRSDFQLFDAETAAAFQASDQATLAADGPRTADEWLTLAETGYHGLFETTRAPIRDAAGRVVGVLGISHDVTARHRAEEDARVSRAQLDGLLATLDEAVWSVEVPTFRTLYVSDSVTALYGYPRERWMENARDMMLRVLHPDDSDSFAEMAASIEKEGQAERVNRVLRADGTSRWVHQKIKKRPTSQDGLARYDGITRDVTAQKATEDELEKHRQTLERLVEVRTNALENADERLRETQFAMDRVGIAIEWFSVPEGRFIHANDAACEMLGYPLEELLSLTPSDIDPTYPGPRWDHLNTALVQNGSIRAETEHRRKDGTMVPVELTLHFEPRLGQGSAGRVIAFVTDISERRATALALEKARDAAEAGSRAKSAFLANMSHEIRTPMNAITGMTYFLAREGTLSPKQKERLERIDIAAKQLLDILDQVLDLSRVESDKLELREEDIDVSRLVDDVAGIVGERARAKGLQAVVEKGPIPRQLRGDATRLRQALLNYGMNAVKFTESGKVTLRLFAVTESEATVTLRFEVEDTGIGIPSESLGRLFRPFEQVDSSTTRPYGGAGLGLAVTKRVVEAMGGEVGAISARGSGSTFWFTVKLPRVVRKPAEATPAASAEAVLRREHAGRRVLLAEDERFNREITGELLRDVGLVVLLVENGREAVALAEREPFDLILTDLDMPEMDGLEATRRIRALPGHERTPIVALTANVLSEDRARCIEAGIDDFLPKPAQPNTVFALLVSWLSAGR